jgi:hypothetical protein
LYGATSKEDLVRRDISIKRWWFRLKLFTGTSKWRLYHEIAVAIISEAITN